LRWGGRKQNRIRGFEGVNMPDFDSRLSARPLYIQVRDMLVGRITEGHWKPGQSLPNETLLARQLGISVGTVRKALDLMEEERVLNRRQGRGTFVTDFAEQPLAFSGFVDRNGETIIGVMRGKEHHFVKANMEEAARLDVRVGDDIIKIERVRLHRGVPFLTETCRLPARLFKDLPEDLVSYRVSPLAQRNSIIANYAEETVSTVLASPQDGRDLDVVPGTPLLALDRLVISNQGDILEWRVGRARIADIRYVSRLPSPGSASRPVRSALAMGLLNGSSRATSS
jgi:GntR family transcriptional regulator